MVLINMTSNQSDFFCLKHQQSPALVYKAGESIFKQCNCFECEHIDLCSFIVGLKNE